MGQDLPSPCGQEVTKPAGQRLRVHPDAELCSSPPLPLLPLLLPSTFRKLHKIFPHGTTSGFSFFYKIPSQARTHTSTQCILFCKLQRQAQPHPNFCAFNILAQQVQPLRKEERGSESGPSMLLEHSTKAEACLGAVKGTPEPRRALPPEAKLRDASSVQHT